jgi:hypothetical protein
MRRSLQRVLLAAALVLPTVVLVSASPAAALTCPPNQIMAVRVIATQPSIVAGQTETVIAKGLNCANTTLSFTEVDTLAKPSPCTTFSGSTADTFKPHQFVKNTIPWRTASNCPGAWSFKIAVFQGTTLLAKSKATWQVTPSAT